MLVKPHLLVVVLSATLLGGSAAGRARADVFVLKDGTRVEGKVSYESEDLIHLDTPNGLVIVNLKDVRRRIITPPPDAALDQAEQERVDRAVNEYTIRLRAIKRSYLDLGKASAAERLFAQGRRRVLALDDPLAIGPLTRILSEGNRATRRLLVEALDRFDDDEATMNLVVIAVLDPAESVRRQAALALLKRGDPRVVSDLRAALKSDEDEVVRNAAVALGILRAWEAARDLVDLLSYTRRATITIPREELISGIQGNYISGIRYRVARGVAQAEPVVGVLSSGSALSQQPIKVRRTVTVYRTEVQEALIAITGQNFGFDPGKWLQWLAQHPAPPPPKN